MWNFDYTSISEITSLLKNNGLSMSKKFGQNFLVKDEALNRIVDLAGISKESKVWEVGPGLGALTSKLLNAGADVTAFEIDRGFCRILKEQAFNGCSSFTLIEGDVLKNWKAEYEKNGLPDLICANLPYNIGSVFIASLIESRCLVPKMVFTLQTEVVKRICSGIGDEQYSGFSILTSLDYENKEAIKLKSGCFWPAPKVDSSVLVMTKKQTSSIPEKQVHDFIGLCRTLFSQRRKTVRNNLKTLGINDGKINEALEVSGIPETERAEKLTVNQILRLSESLNRISSL